MTRATPSRGGPARERKRTRARGWRSLERRHDLLRDELELAHDVPVRHAGEEQAADQVVHPVLLDEWLEVPDHLVGIADEEAVLLDRVEIGGDRSVDEGMLP